ncbi:MAG: formylglycine-generating enzyme family protein [Kiritimatiellia bacterium]
MMKRTLIMAAMTAAVTARAVPSVTNVQMMQREKSRIVDITYTLADETAIVTLAIETNGVPLPDSAVTSLFGDVCKEVPPGDGAIVWNAGADWPECSVTNAKARVTAWSLLAPPQVMVVDLSKGTGATAQDPYPARYYTSLEALPYGGVTNVAYKTGLLVLRKLPAGHFFMGVEGKGVSTTLTQDFYAGVYEVTQEQWSRVMGVNLSDFKGDDKPVNRVSYYDIREVWSASGSWVDGGSAISPNWPATNAVGSTSFMGKLRERTGMTGFDLPTDAQWEYLCRAGTTTYFNDGAIVTNVAAQLNVLGWWNDNALGVVHTVGQLLPNEWGLYDTHGNVWEFSLNFFTNTLYAATDPKGPLSNSDGYRMTRSGTINSGTSSCCSSYRGSTWPSRRLNMIGFRVVRNFQ